MIVILNQKSLLLTVYNNDGVHSIPFEQAELLEEMARDGEQVLYVINAISTNVESVVATVGTLLGQRREQLRDAGETMYLHSTLPGVLNIPDLYSRTTRKKEDLIFRSIKDAIPLKQIARDFGKDIFQTNRIMRDFLREGKLQVITETELRDLTERFDSGLIPKSKHHAQHYKKYLKTLEPGIDPDDPIVFDITKNVLSAIRSGGGSSGRETNENTLIDFD